MKRTRSVQKLERVLLLRVMVRARDARRGRRVTVDGPEQPAYADLSRVSVWERCCQRAASAAGTP